MKTPYAIGEPLVPTIRELVGFSRSELTVIPLGILKKINYATNGTGKRTLYTDLCQVRGVFSVHHDNLTRGMDIADGGYGVFLIPAKGIVTIMTTRKWNKTKSEFVEIITLDEQSLMERNNQLRNYQLPVTLLPTENGGVVEITL
jgi:hypothetical protein